MHTTTHEPADTRFWDRSARAYATSKIDDPEGYEHTLARVGALLRPQHRVLELGCGTGTTALRLAPLAQSWLGTDISPEMITIAREKLAAAPLPGLRFETATAATAPEVDGGFEMIVGFNYLHLVQDLAGTLATIRARLRSGGLFITKTACIIELNPLVRLAIPLMQWAGKAPATVAVFGEAALVEAIVGAGFTVEAVERHGVKGRDVRAVVVARG